MKVFEVLSDQDTLKTDLKKNKGRAVTAIVRGAKRKSNGEDEDVIPKQETNTTTVMG